MKRLRDTTGPVPERLERWQREIFKTGSPFLNCAVPREYWQAWRDSDEARAAWRHHKTTLLRGEADPGSWWAVLHYDRGQTAQEIEGKKAAEYLSTMTAYQQERQRLVDEMAKRISAQKRRERGSAGSETVN